MPAEKRSSGAEPAPIRRCCGLEHITLDMALLAAPEDWRAAIEQHGRPSWHGLVGTAYERAGMLGISPDAWAQAQAALGPAGAAILVLIADARSLERGGPIRSAGGWVRRMAERAETGAAHLHRSLYGILHGTGAA